MASLPSAGSIFADKLRIDAVLGRGSMGIVYGATDLILGRRVALKVIAPEVLDGDQRLRFEREARAAAALRSEHAVRIYEAGSTPMPYLVMEYLEGQNLEHHVAEHGPLPVAQAVAYLLEALDAIAEAHRAGFVHRDLKPANLFLDRSRALPMVKVLDFGLVRTIEPSRTPLTAAGATMGTPLYMAPEQVDAQPVDPRADVWSLGVTLYELLTGRTPFEAPTTMDVLTRILRHAPIPIQQWRPDVPAELIAILERCLAKRPDDRFASGVELAASLANAAGPRTTPSHVILVTRPEPRPPLRRSSGALVFLAGAGATLVLGIAGGTFLALHPGSKAIPTIASIPSASAAASASRTSGLAPAVSPAPLPPPVFPSIRPAERIHHVHAEPGAGFEDREKFDAWSRRLDAPLERCARQLLCYGVTVALNADGSADYIMHGAARKTQADPAGCVVTDTTGTGQCFSRTFRRSKPPVTCGSDAGTCRANLVVYVDD